jgi:hypothetical protein
MSLRRTSPLKRQLHLFQLLFCFAVDFWLGAGVFYDGGGRDARRYRGHRGEALRGSRLETHGRPASENTGEDVVETNDEMATKPEETIK